MKLLNSDNLEQTVKELKKNHDRIILVGGCFDIIHNGHIEFLKRSKKLGGKLIVMLESDASVKRRKGINRPTNKQKDRAVALSFLPSVDYVLLISNFKSNDEYARLVKDIEPDIIAITAGDPLLEVKKNQAKMVGGRVIEVMERNPEHSTTKLLKMK